MAREHRRLPPVVDAPTAPPYTAPHKSGEAAVAPENIDRRLAAIMSADVVGYSRLMGADDAAALDSAPRLVANPP